MLQFCLFWGISPRRALQEQGNPVTVPPGDPAVREGKLAAQGHTAGSTKAAPNIPPRSGSEGRAPRTTVSKVYSPAPVFKPVCVTLAQGRGEGLANGSRPPGCLWQGRQLSRRDAASGPALL